MSFGYSANQANTIEQEFVAEVAPQELKSFIEALETAEVELADFAYNVWVGYLTDIGEAEWDAYTKLTEAFEQETNLKLGLGWHDTDEGSSYDEVDGAFWMVEGVYQMTEAGQKYMDKIEIKSWVVGG